MKLLFYCCTFIIVYVVIYHIVTRINNIKLEAIIEYQHSAPRDTVKIDYPQFKLHVLRREIVIDDLTDHIVITFKQIPFFSIKDIAAIRLVFCPWDLDTDDWTHVCLEPGEYDCIRIRLYMLKVLYHDNHVVTYDIDRRNDIVAFERPYVITECYITDIRTKGDRQNVVECK